MYRNIFCWCLVAAVSQPTKNGTIIIVMGTRHHRKIEKKNENCTQWKLVQPLKFNFSIIWTSVMMKTSPTTTTSLEFNLCKFHFEQSFFLRRLSLNHFVTVHKFVMENFYLKEKINFHGLVSGYWGSEGRDDEEKEEAGELWHVNFVKEWIKIV